MAQRLWGEHAVGCNGRAGPDLRRAAAPAGVRRPATSVSLILRRPARLRGLALCAASAPRYPRQANWLEGVMHFKAAGVTAFLVLSWSSFAAAGPAVDAAEQAEALAAEGKTVEALDALDAGGRRAVAGHSAGIPRRRPGRFGQRLRPLPGAGRRHVPAATRRSPSMSSRSATATAADGDRVHRRPGASRTTPARS